MMKIFLLIFQVTFVVIANEEVLPRVASGLDARPFEGLDYVILNVAFVNQWQRCGGSLIAPQYVLTSATCLYDPIEGTANVVNVTSPRSSNLFSSNMKIYLHPDYDFDTHESDIAILKLNTTIITDKFTSFAVLDTNNTLDVYYDVMLRGCGMGSTSNYPKYPKNLQCTDLVAVDAASCSELTNIICTQWPDRDNNLCNGDFGSPIYNIVYNSTQYPTVTVVGIAAYSPDYRPSAPCLGGQKISHVQVAGYLNWINGIISK